MMNNRITLTLPADIRFIRLVSSTASNIAGIISAETASGKEKSEFCHAFELALSEAFSNSVLNKNPGDIAAKVIIVFESADNGLMATVTDSNLPFDPDKQPPLEIDRYPEKGFGLFLIRQLMDTVNYRRERGCNCLSMTKRPATPNQ
jgi:serine/threonine-protein kinase RsbW